MCSAQDLYRSLTDIGVSERILNIKLRVCACQPIKNGLLCRCSKQINKYITEYFYQPQNG